MLVSVCIPTYNGEEYLREALYSVKTQTYQNIEVIISDDNSTDNTLEICEEFKKEVPFPVTIIKHNPNGIGANWDNCIEKANGKFIKFLFQDDLLEPNCLEAFIAIADKTKEKVFFCKRNLINEGGNIILNEIKKVSDLQSVINLTINNFYIFTKKDLRLIGINFPDEPHHNAFGEPVASFISKDVFVKTGKFQPLKQLLDIDYWFRILKNYNVVILEEKLISFRVHDEQTSSKNRINKIDETSAIKDFLLKNFFRYFNKNVKLSLLYYKFPLIKKIRGKFPFS